MSITFTSDSRTYGHDVITTVIPSQVCEIAQKAEQERRKKMTNYEYIHSASREDLIQAIEIGGCGHCPAEDYCSMLWDGKSPKTSCRDELELWMDKTHKSAPQDWSKYVGEVIEVCNNPAKGDMWRTRELCMYLPQSEKPFAVYENDFAWADNTTATEIVQYKYARVEETE